MRGSEVFRANPLQRFVRSVGLLLLVALALALLAPGRVDAATAPSLGTATSFAVLAASTVTNTGPTTLNGDLGLSPGSAVTGFPPGAVTGAMHVADAAAQGAQNDVTTAYNALGGQPCDVMLTGQDLGGMTLTPGVYCFTSSAQLTGTLTLNAQGNANAAFIFKIGSTLTTASSSTVQVINGGSPCNVFWQVGSSATIGTTTTFVGNILALTSISLTTGATLAGRALARTAAVTMDTNNVSFASCALAVTPAPATATATSAAPPGATTPGTVVVATMTPAPPNAAPPEAPATPTIPAATAPVTATPGAGSLGTPGSTPVASATIVPVTPTSSPAAPVVIPGLPNTGGSGGDRTGLFVILLVVLALIASSWATKKRHVAR